MEKQTMLVAYGSRKFTRNRKQKPLTYDISESKRSVVGALGFEPRASYTPCKRASRTAPRPDFRSSL